VTDTQAGWAFGRILAVITKHGRPTILAVSFDDRLLNVVVAIVAGNVNALPS